MTGSVGIVRLRQVAGYDEAVSHTASGAASPQLYRRHRFPAEIISHGVWLYYRFLLSYRDVEELLAERGVSVSYETVRQWCHKFGSTFASRLQRRRPRPGDKWHLDEVVLKINGRRHYLWRAVDQEGIVLDILVQQRRNREAAEIFLRRLLDGQGYEPRVLITDNLGSYGAARKRLLPHVEHRQHKGLNNRAENSHRPTRRRERALQRFKSPAHAQQFLAPFGPISNHFRPRRHLLPAPLYRYEMQTRFQTWREVTGLAVAA